MIWRLEFILAWMLTFAGLVRAQEVYSALLNIPGNAPASLFVQVRGYQTAGWTTSATVKIPSGAAGTTRSVTFLLSTDCAVGHVYNSPAGTVPGLTAACWPIPAAVATPDWWGMSISLTDAERKAVAALAGKVGIAVAVQPTESFVTAVLVAWPVP